MPNLYIYFDAYQYNINKQELQFLYMLTFLGICAIMRKYSECNIVSHVFVSH